MANLAIMESPSNQLHPCFPDFWKVSSQIASPNPSLTPPTHDPLNAYQDSTTYNCFNDQIGLCASSPFVADDLHQAEIALLPLVLENLEIANGRNRRKRKNVGKACVKRRWSKYEDRLLVQLVEQYGDRSWALVASKLPMRIGKQCRERWHNCLNPNIVKNGWSEEDDKLLIVLHKQFGNSWANIAKSMPGRSENSIKNHWNATKRKRSEFSSCLLKDYIASVSSSSADDQINIQESSSVDPQSHEPMISLNARPASTSFSGSAVGYMPDEVGFNDGSSHLVDQLEYDPLNDMDFLDSLFDTSRM